MSSTAQTAVQNISLVGLAIALAPALAVLGILSYWSLNTRDAAWAIGRMLLQLVIIGYVLSYLFAARHAGLVLLILTAMMVAASMIAMRPLSRRDARLYGYAFTSIVAGGLSTLALVVGFVIDVDPWFAPRYVIPLGGMIFAASMNAVSLAAERFEAETERQLPTDQAVPAALQAALIPVINSLLAVGLVTLPGMMTGQILSGVPPLVAARYQIVVMSMILGASGISAAVFLALVRRSVDRDDRHG